MEFGQPFDWVIGGAFSAVGYFVRSHDKRLNRMENTQITTTSDLHRHMMDSEKRYAKEETMQQSLGRIHDKMEEGFREIREDIKALIKARS